MCSELGVTPSEGVPGGAGHASTIGDAGDPGESNGPDTRCPAVAAACPASPTLPVVPQRFLSLRDIEAQGLPHPGVSGPPRLRGREAHVTKSRGRAARVAGRRGRATGVTVLALMAAALGPGRAHAQDRTPATFDLVGTVTDQAGVPLVGAFVAPEGSEWGSLTGRDGRFVLPNTPRGQITLTAELLGYEKLTWTGLADAGRPIPLTLVSKPILLEGLTIVANRFEYRRRAAATSVRWFDQHALATSPQDNALEFLATRGGLFRVPCSGVWSQECFVVRGRVTEPSVWVDEAPLIGGLDYLRVIPPHELYLMEIYGSGRHIRAYTTRFMERAAERRIWPIPLY